jgi:hypothetical protein
MLPGRAIGAGGLGLLLVLGSAGTSFAQGKPADLTATPTAVTIMVPAHHQNQPVSVEIISSQAIPATDKLGASMLGDLVRDDSAARIPRSAVQISITPDNSDATSESFVLTLMPNLSGVDPGKYSGNIRVTGPNANPLIVPVTMSIQGGSWFGVLALLLVGLLVGWLLKWYTDAGSKLAVETRRYSGILRKIGDTPAANMPKFMLDELGDVTQGFNHADQAKVDAALTLLEGQAGGLAAVTDVVGHLRDSIQAHDSEIQQQRLAFDQIPTNERRRLNDALNEAPDLATAKTGVSGLLTCAIAITTCLQHATDTGDADVLTLFDQDRFDDALGAFNSLQAAAPASPPAAAAAAAAAPAVGGAANPARLQSLLRTGIHLEDALAAPGGAALPPVRGVAARAAKWPMTNGAAWRVFLGWLPFIIGILTVIIIALIGLKTQWASNLTFGSGGAIDYIALFLWGVAAFVTGKTLSDFLSTVVSK